MPETRRILHAEEVETNDILLCSVRLITWSFFPTRGEPVRHNKTGKYGWIDGRAWGIIPRVFVAYSLRNTGKGVYKPSERQGRQYRLLYHCIEPNL
jgi:hypothetical protein